MTEECKWSYTKDGKHREFTLPGPFANAEGKKVCQDCLKYLGLVNPAPKEASPVTSTDMNSLKLLMNGTLTEWETKFLNDIKAKPEWTKNQRTTFEKVRDKYFKQSAPAQPQTTAVTYDVPDDFNLF